MRFEIIWKDLDKCAYQCNNNVSMSLLLLHPLLRQQVQRPWRMLLHAVDMAGFRRSSPSAVCQQARLEWQGGEDFLPHQCVSRPGFCGRGPKIFCLRGVSAGQVFVEGAEDLLSQRCVSRPGFCCRGPKMVSALRFWCRTVLQEVFHHHQRCATGAHRRLSPINVELLWTCDAWVSSIHFSVSLYYDHLPLSVPARGWLLCVVRRHDLFGRLLTAAHGCPALRHCLQGGQEEVSEKMLGFCRQFSDFTGQR